MYICNSEEPYDYERETLQDVLPAEAAPFNDGPFLPSVTPPEGPAMHICGEEGLQRLSFQQLLLRGNTKDTYLCMTIRHSTVGKVINRAWTH